ncbi:MAG TPA: hypothetical protein PKN13_01985 [Accumulibacter sp.]|nr:hypothetical protein [Accumulibacter sp.]HNG37487.1 hypothetical protein [Accumulibacter sp.]HNL12440.1 hypothetical protein [Accumulibacter sp.]HNL76380.1 hypothetical protein [Accumulibacter sp.]HNM74104.1 hypothetical protein [Accumulibacter sp.]
MVIVEGGTRATIPLRDTIPQDIADQRIAGGKSGSSYHRRRFTIPGTKVWFKQFGNSPHFSTFERQANAPDRVAIANTLTDLGMPKPVRTGQVVPAS